MSGPGDSCDDSMVLARSQTVLGTTPAVAFEAQSGHTRPVQIRQVRQLSVVHEPILESTKSKPRFSRMHALHIFRQSNLPLLVAETRTK